jgi:hypothetical protein
VTRANEEKSAKWTYGWVPGMLASFITPAYACRLDGGPSIRLPDGPWRVTRVEGTSVYADGNAWTDGKARDLMPDLNDAATRGCVVELVRKRKGDPAWCVVAVYLDSAGEPYRRAAPGRVIWWAASDELEAWVLSAGRALWQHKPEPTRPFYATEATAICAGLETP